MKFSTRVVGVENVGRELILLTVDTKGTPIADSYTRAGQYLMLETEHSAPGYFSLASVPGDSNVQFLIRHQAHKAKTGPLTELKPGDTVELSQAQGVGYPVFEQEGRDLLLIATGTGIAPLRVILRLIAPERKRFGDITLIYGAVDEHSLAFREEYDEWKAMGVKLCLCLSRPRKNSQVCKGYVQDVIPQHIHDPARISAFVCGHPPMIEKVSRCLVEHRVPLNRIFINH